MTKVILIVIMLFFSIQSWAEKTIQNKEINIEESKNIVLEEIIENEDEYSVGNDVDDLSKYIMHIKISEYFVKGNKYFFINKEDLYFLGKNKISKNISIISKKVKLEKYATLNEIDVNKEENFVNFVFDNDLIINISNIDIDEDLSLIKKEIDKIVFKI